MSCIHFLPWYIILDYLLEQQSRSTANLFLTVLNNFIQCIKKYIWMLLSLPRLCSLYVVLYFIPPVYRVVALATGTHVCLICSRPNRKTPTCPACKVSACPVLLHLYFQPFFKLYSFSWKLILYFSVLFSFLSFSLSGFLSSHCLYSCCIIWY